MKKILVNDSPGFVSNRVMLTYINEAIFCVAEGVASAKWIWIIPSGCLSGDMGKAVKRNCLSNNSLELDTGS